ncbi:hypothetical protein TanjilG_21887 [Lupinus angustifolius]|uniref:Transcriptional corepressor SEUSS-like n=1 Tax=Lupinus angustifolius TaxID=3871 RepID=A0A1J7FN68_LUPAN|nr:PREDICTED: transcriptional corepressor SEUSS-like [Lupinus angustifolius]OIV89429.1 hypothetical protein TanjilG_21887 [Lupinus angustifolius]
MVPPVPSSTIGGAAQSMPPSVLVSDSGMLRGQGVAPLNQINNLSMLGDLSNVNFPNSGPGSSQRGGVDNEAEFDPLSGVGNGFSYVDPSPSSSSFLQSNMMNPGSSNQGQGQQFLNRSGNQLLSDQQHSQQLEYQGFQHSQQSMQQSPAPANDQQQQQQQQHFQSMRGGIGSIGPVKFESQVNNDQFGQHQHMPLLRNLAPPKLEPQHTDQPLLTHQQQQQLLDLSRQSPQAAAAVVAHMKFLIHQRHSQSQQQQPQQLVKTVPQQWSQQSQQQDMPIRSPEKSIYGPGTCSNRLTHYMHQQQHRPEDNNIEFWRKFVAEYFAPNAKKKWCVSMYESGKQTAGVFPQDVRHCAICNCKPGRGFEAPAEVLPRLFKIKYESGTLQELLYVDMPREHHNSSGHIVVDYAKAIQESVFEKLRVVREGQLRIVFSPDLKICSWEFCARRHEDLIPKDSLIPQISQLGTAAQKFQSCTQSATSNSSVLELQNNCNMFVASAHGFAKALEVPLVNELGYTKRYVRCLQIAEVVNSMKDLIDYCKDSGTGPMDSLVNFPRRTSSSSGLHSHPQQSEDQSQKSQPQQQQHMVAANTSNGDQKSSQNASSNGFTSVNNALNSASASTTTSTIVGLHHQNMNSRQQSSMNYVSSPYGGSSLQIPRPSSSGTVLQPQPSTSTFQPPAPSSSNNPPQPSANHTSRAKSPADISSQQQQPLLSGEADANELMSSQVNGTGGMTSAGSLGNDVNNVNNVNEIQPVCNAVVNGNSGVRVGGYGTMGTGPSGTANGNRPKIGGNSGMNGRIGMTSIARDQSVNNHQQDLSSQLVTGLGSVNDFDNLQFD